MTLFFFSNRSFVVLCGLLVHCQIIIVCSEMFKLSRGGQSVKMFGVTLPLVIYMYVSRDIL